MAWWRLLLDIDKVALDDSYLTLEGIKNQPAIIEQKRQVTTRISETTRTLAYGSLASCYALLVANKELAAVFAEARPLLLMCACLGIAAIIIDAAQYLFAYINVQQGLRLPKQIYPANWSRNGRALCFIFKQLFAYAAAGLLLASVARILI